MTWNLSRQITVSEAHFELVRVLETSTNDLNHSVTLAGTTLRVNFVNTDGRVEKTAVTTSEDVRKDTLICACSLLCRGLDNHLGRSDRSLATMTDVALTPGVGAAHFVESVRCKLAAGHFVEERQLLSLIIQADSLGVPLCLHVSVTSLAINTESPGVKFTLVGEGSRVTETCRTGLGSDGLTIFIGWKTDTSWQSHDLLLANAELTHPGFTPCIHGSIVYDSERIEGACSDV